MKLLVISHTPHLKVSNNNFGWGPTIREVNFLSQFFQITHIAPCKLTSKVPESYAETSQSIRLVPTRNRGGVGFLRKLKVSVDAFQYLKLIMIEIGLADIVHVRCPSNISIVALLILIFSPKKKKWIKYAGDWHPTNDYFSYKMQRFIIRNLLSNHVVTVNGTYKERTFIHHLVNPSFSKDEIETNLPYKSLGQDPVIILFVGGLTPNKGVDIVVNTVLNLSAMAFTFKLYIIGDGPERDNLIDLSTSKGLSDKIYFEGWKSKEALKEYYRKAHFILLPSRGEGWPKVVSEAMSFGVVPLVSDVSGIKETLDKIGVGVAIKKFDPSNYTNEIRLYLENPQKWIRESRLAIGGANQFTFENWFQILSALFRKRWNLKNDFKLI